MKFKKLITILTVSTMVLGNSVWSYAEEVPKDLEVKQEYSDMETRMEQERLRIEQEILEGIENSPVTLSEGEVNPMGLPDIDPVTNPARDNWLTRTVAKRSGKSDVSQLTQEDFNKITLFEIYNSELTEIPPEIGNLYNLERFQTTNNKIPEIPKEIGNLIKLEKLGLSSNQITKIPSQIFNLTNLRMLDLGNNKIVKIPSEISNLINLQSLNFETNQITEIPPEVFKLANLKWLNISFNQITKIPPQISSLINLQQLHLSYNQIAEIPPQISSLFNLKNLYLDCNKIIKIPAEISSLNNLVFLYLDDNQITEIPAEIGNLTNLKDLGLRNNQISKLPPDLSNLSLTTLDLINQTIKLNNKFIKENEKFIIQNPISVFDKAVIPKHISNNGVYNPIDNTITWVASDKNRNETFSFSQAVTIGQATEDFLGSVTIPTIIGEEEPLSLSISNGAASQTISTSETLSVPVSLKGTGNYYALDTQIEYDSELLEFKGYSIKKGLKAYYSSNENNTLRYILASQGKDNPINSSVSDVVYLNFTPKQAGITNVKIKAGQVANLDKEINITTLGTIAVTIEDKPIVVSKDVNRDGKFSLIDLAIDGYYYGMSADETDKTKYDADIIPDGKIDDADLKEIVKFILNNKEN